MDSAGNDFNISALDDPSSYAALMTPLDPAMIAFFNGRSWPMSLLLPIIISQIRVIPRAGNGKTVRAFAFYTQQDPAGQKFVYCRPPSGIAYRDSYSTTCEYKLWEFGKLEEAGEVAKRVEECRARLAFCVPPAVILITYLTESGLVFQVPAGAVPGLQQSLPPARICFDSLYSTFATGDSLSNVLGTFFDFHAVEGHPPLKLQDIRPLEEFSDTWGVTDRNKQPTSKVSSCDNPNTPWIKPFSSQQGAGSQQQSAGGAGGGGTGASSLCINGACAASKTVTASKTMTATPRQVETPMYEFYDQRTDAIFQIYTRSTWAIYQYLGAMMRRDQETGLPTSVLVRGFQKDHDLFRVERGSLGCFTSVRYSGTQYCVRRDAFNTKMILSLLHELANLYTKPNATQQPNTGTTRLTP